MLFSSSVPDKLQEYPNVSAFMGVLDALQNFKSEVIADSFRVGNVGILMDKKWLLRKLDEFGVSLPLDYPIQIIRQYLLNVDTVCRTRGSKKGIELYCSLLSFGEVAVDDSEFYSTPEILLLDSPIQGFITENNTRDIFYLCESNSNTVSSGAVLSITIKSKYFDGNYPAEELLIKSYLESTIGNQLGFSPNRKVVFDYQPRDEFYFHDLLNPYFV